MFCDLFQKITLTHVKSCYVRNFTRNTLVLDLPGHSINHFLIAGQSPCRFPIKCPQRGLNPRGRQGVGHFSKFWSQKNSGRNFKIFRKVPNFLDFFQKIALTHVKSCSTCNFTCYTLVLYLLRYSISHFLIAWQSVTGGGRPAGRTLFFRGI